MFGYIKPDKMDLKLKEIHRYQDYYCGLCYSIRAFYGSLYAFGLSYDITFLLTLLDDYAIEKIRLEFRCPMNHKKKVIYVSEEARQYSAFINYLLIILKLEDDIKDDKSCVKKILKNYLERNPRYFQIKSQYIEIVEDLSCKLGEFYSLESRKQDFDALSNSFGLFFGDIFKWYFRKNDISGEDDIFYLSFNLGKWIFLMDAYDDYVKDIRNGSYNALNSFQFYNEEFNMLQVHHRVYDIMNMLIDKMENCIDHIQLSQNNEIIKNIVTTGCREQYYRILKKRYPNYYKQVTGLKKSIHE